MECVARNETSQRQKQDFAWKKQRNKGTYKNIKSHSPFPQIAKKKLMGGKSSTMTIKMPQMDMHMRHKTPWKYFI